MTDKGQKDEFMDQCMATCKEQIEKLAKDPDLLSQTLKPFMEMSQQLMASGGAVANMVPDLGGLNVYKMVMQMKGMIDYIKDSYKELIKAHSVQDGIIKDLDESSKKLRGLVKKLIEKIEENNQ
ncbi:MAG: hypothetical protein PV340_00555 [Wolbachia sp.]|nr:hypothetical protein [Wolbachia sp.]MDD9336823.1 hypothetical protein [Wolbachia sp.]